MGSSSNSSSGGGVRVQKGGAAVLPFIFLIYYDGAGNLKAPPEDTETDMEKINNKKKNYRKKFADAQSVSKT